MHSGKDMSKGRISTKRKREIENILDQGQTNNMLSTYMKFYMKRDKIYWKTEPESKLS